MGVIENFRVGLDLPTIEVRFEHVNVEAEAYVGSRALPSFINFNISIFEVIYILKNIRGFIQKHFVYFSKILYLSSVLSKLKSNYFVFQKPKSNPSTLQKK